MELRILEADEIVRIHEYLVEDFAASGDPIEPAGVRNRHLLESAASRQNVGSGGHRKYPTPVSNAATLAYGICHNHAFHNGNKRTALVSTLVHLDRNKLSLWGTDQDGLYDFMLAVADHRIVNWVGDGATLSEPIPSSLDRPSADDEIGAIESWLVARVAAIKRGDRTMSYRELRKVLQRFGYSFATHKQSQVRIVREVGERTTSVMTIHFPGETREVSIGLVKQIRNRCRLREEDGVDSEVFYDGYNAVDEFINKYRVVLRRLGET